MTSDDDQTAPSIAAVTTAAVTIDAAALARLQAEKEALTFDCELLRRETSRLTALTRTLEARLMLAERQREHVQHYLGLVEGSLPWRVVQAIRGWFGRRWK